MQPERKLAVDEIRLSDPAFWGRPRGEREGAFATLREERPVSASCRPRSRRGAFMRVSPSALRIGFLLLCILLVACGGPEEHRHPETPEESPELQEPAEPQESQSSEQLDLGALEGSVYSNPFFGLRMSLPEGWAVMDAEMQGLARGIDAHVRKDAERRSFNVVTAFEHPFGAEVLFNPSIQCFVEDLRFLPEIERGADYVEDSRKALEAGPFAISFSDEVTTRSLDGVEFDVLQAAFTTATGVPIRQRYYATVLKGHALACALAFDTEETEAALEAVIASIRFDD
jgi:hypothetical protein